MLTLRCDRWEESSVGHFVKPRHTHLIVKHVPCHSPTQTHTETNTSPVGFKEHPLTCLSAHLDCQHVTVPKLDDSESRSTVNKRCVRGCREGTERLVSVGGTDYSYRSPAQRGMKINTHILSTLHNCLPLTSRLSI